MGTATATAPAKTDAKPKNVTIRGRLSFPVFTAQEAFDKAQASPNMKFKPATVADAKPEINLLLEQSQLDKLRSHILDVYFPYIVDREKNGESKDALTADEVKKLTEQIMLP